MSTVTPEDKAKARQVIGQMQFAGRKAEDIIAHAIADARGEAGAMLQWIVQKCQDPGKTVEQIGRELCAVIAGGRVGAVIYPNEMDALRAALEEHSAGSGAEGGKR